MAEAIMRSIASQEVPFRRDILERIEIAGAEALLGLTELAPGTSTGTLTHPGYEMAYVIAGTCELLVEGDPPRRLEAGDSFHLDGHRPHQFRNTGPSPTRSVVAWVAGK